MDKSPIKLTDGGSFTGAFIIRKHRAGEIKYSMVGGKMVVDLESLRAAKANPLWESPLIKNKIVAGASGNGVNVILRQLGADTTYPIAISEVRLGDSTTPPTNADTSLGNQLVTGITIALATPAASTLTLDIFAPSASVPNHTYQEIALYCGLKMFARALLGAYVKGTNQDTTIEYVITATT